MSAGRAQVVVIPVGEHNLEQLQGARPEGRSRTRQIHVPRPGEVRVIQFGDLVLNTFKSFHPVLQGSGVVQPQVLHVQH